MLKFKLASLLVIFVLATGCGNEHLLEKQINEAWESALTIPDSIPRPAIPDRSLLLTELGASGDGLHDNKPVFDSAISALSGEGGGKLIVPPGDYLVNGPIHLESNIELHLQEGSRLMFSSDTVHYLPVVPTSWEGTRLYNYSPLIYAFQKENIALTGKGVIDGESSGTWATWKQIQDPDKLLLRKMNNENVPPEERVFGGGHFLRPHLIQFYGCKNILVEDVTMTDAPFWCLHLVFCRYAHVKGVRYDAQNPNNDGIDPESSQYVLIEDIAFNNMDDNIAIKAGRDLEARSLGIPSEYILVRNCLFRGWNAFAIGSEMSGGVKNIFMEDCSFSGRVEYGIYLKGNRDRGGTVERIFVREVEFDSCRSAITIDSDYKNEGTCCPPAFRNVFIRDVRCNVAEDHGIYLRGFETSPLDKISISDATIGSAKIPVDTSFAGNPELERITINGRNYSNN